MGAAIQHCANTASPCHTPGYAGEPPGLTDEMGLVPSWAKNPAIGSAMINARSETAATKPAFREALQQRRCLIPADGFYEWLRTGSRKQPYCFEMQDGDPFAFAGLWDRWRAPDGALLETCTILTTTPNSLLVDVHDRMPAILPNESYDLWLDSEFRGLSALTELLQPYGAGHMRRFPIGQRINNVANDDPHCVDRVEVPQSSQPDLF